MGLKGPLILIFPACDKILVVVTSLHNQIYWVGLIDLARVALFWIVEEGGRGGKPRTQFDGLQEWSLCLLLSSVLPRWNANNFFIYRVAQEVSLQQIIQKSY